MGQQKKHLSSLSYSITFISCLQSKLQECEKSMDELESELQRANNKVCHTGHLLNQMTIKVHRSSSLYIIFVIGTL